MLKSALETEYWEMNLAAVETTINLASKSVLEWPDLGIIWRAGCMNDYRTEVNLYLKICENILGSIGENSITLFTGIETPG